MKKRVSITACRHAILITVRGNEPGIPLEIGGEEQRITDIEIQGLRWYSGDHRLTRGQQEKLTERAYVIIANDQQARPAPKISFGIVRRRSGLPAASGFRSGERSV